MNPSLQRPDLVGGFITACLVILYLSLEGTRYAYTWDEAQLGLTALGVLRGEVPHKDLFDSYTALLGLTGGTLFALLGINSLYLRFPLFLALIVAFPLLYITLSTFKTKREAALVTLLTFSVSSAAQLGPTPVPLFPPLTIIATCALWHFVQRGSLLWVAVAGGVTGILIGVKITGIYLILANVLILGFNRFKLVVSGLSLILLGVLFPALTFGDKILSSLPLCAIAIIALSRIRLSSQDRGLLPFITVGIATFVPIAAIILWFVSHDAVTDLIDGVIIRPRARISFTQIDPPPFAAWLLGSMIVGVGAAASAVRPPVGHLILLIGIPSLLLFPSSLFSHELYRTLPPILSLVLAIIVPKKEWTAVARFASLALIEGAYLWLNMIPYSDPAYGASLSALIFLAAFVFIEVRGTGMAYFAGALTLGIVTTSWFRGPPLSYGGLALIHPYRGGVYVDKEWSDALKRGCSIVHARSKEGEQIFAGPDLPEIPFFCDRPPSINLVHDFFAPDRARAHLKELPFNSGISLIALNWRDNFSQKYDEVTLEELRSAFPLFENVYYRGQLMWELRWRDEQ